MDIHGYGRLAAPSVTAHELNRAEDAGGDQCELCGSREFVAPIWHKADAPPLRTFSQIDITLYHRARCSGAAERARTVDIQLGKLTLYQLSYSRK
jgi:hypothetical protein